MKILLTGGAGYVGSACLRWLLEHGHDPIAYDDLSEGNRAAVPGRIGRLIVGRDRRHRRAGRGDARPRRRGGDALRGAGLGPRVGRPSRAVLSGQRGRDQERAGRDAEGRGPPDRLQQHVRDLRGPRRDAAARGLAAAPRDALRQDQAGLRVDDPGLRAGLRPGLRRAPLLQRRGGRPRRRLRRGPSPRGAPDPPGAARGRRQAAQGDDLRYRLPDPGRELRARLHPHRGPGAGAPARHRGDRAGQGAGVQRRHGGRRHGPRGAAGLRGGGRPADPARVRRPTAGRPGGADRLGRPAPERAGLVAPLPRHPPDRPDRLGLASPPPRRLRRRPAPAPTGAAVETPAP